MSGQIYTANRPPRHSDGPFIAGDRWYDMSASKLYIYMSGSKTGWLNYNDSDKHQMIVDINAGDLIESSSQSRMPCVIKESDTSYKMWYVGYNGTTYTMLYAKSDDGFIWNNHQVLFGVITGEKYVYYPCVIKESDTSYKMWYTAVLTDDTFQVKYATSVDGLNWDNHQVIIDGSLSEGPTIHTKTAVTSAIPRDNGYSLFIQAEVPGTTTDPTQYQILRCDSTDGINIDFVEVVVPLNSIGIIDSMRCMIPRVTQIGSKYLMCYRILGVGELYSVALCESTDCSTWTDHRVLFSINMQGIYDTKQTYPGFILYDNGVYRLYWPAYDIYSKIRIMHSISTDEFQTFDLDTQYLHINEDTAARSHWITIDYIDEGWVNDVLEQSYKEGKCILIGSDWSGASNISLSTNTPTGIEMPEEY